MKTIFCAGMIAAALVAATHAHAQPLSFDPAAYHQMVKEPTQILVLGAAHLQNTPQSWDPSALKLVLDKLAAFKPDAITIEALPGESIDTLWRYRGIYPDVAKNYVGGYMTLAALARINLGLNAPQAEAEVRKALAQWPAKPTPAQRRHLAALFIASGDPNSALVQWWRLPPGERVAKDGVTGTLRTMLETLGKEHNEGNLIGARLAARLGLERVYPIDDHGADDAEQDHEKAIEAFFAKPWVQEVVNNPRFAALGVSSDHLRNPAEAMDTFRMLNANAPDHTDAGLLDLYMRALLSHPKENAAGRTQIATLETRNLRQVANIREVASHYPGKRILVIIGASHKPWFQAYLSKLSDVELVDTEQALH